MVIAEKVVRSRVHLSDKLQSCSQESVAIVQVKGNVIGTLCGVRPLLYVDPSLFS